MVLPFIAAEPRLPGSGLPKSAPPGSCWLSRAVEEPCSRVWLLAPSPAGFLRTVVLAWSWPGLVSGQASPCTLLSPVSIWVDGLHFSRSRSPSPHSPVRTCCCGGFRMQVGCVRAPGPAQPQLTWDALVTAGDCCIFSPALPPSGTTGRNCVSSERRTHRDPLLPMRALLSLCVWLTWPCLSRFSYSFPTF